MRHLTGRYAISIGLLVLSLLLVTAGLLLGDVGAEMLLKARVICLECMGIG